MKGASSYLPKKQENVFAHHPQSLVSVSLVKCLPFMTREEASSLESIRAALLPAPQPGVAGLGLLIVAHFISL